MQAWLDVDEEAIRHNFRVIKQKVGRTVGVIPVLKADAYGLGLVPVAEILDKEAVEMFAVLNWQELITLRRQTTKPVLILGYLDIKGLTEAILQEEIFSLFDREMVPLIERTAQRLKKVAKVHLKIDTGLSRMGLSIAEATDFLSSLRFFSHIKVEALYSHLATPSDYVSNLEQLRRLQDMLVAIQGKVEVLPIHFVSSNGLQSFPDGYFDAVRVGLALFGTKPILPGLQSALTCKTVVMQIKQLAPGETIGYDKEFVVTQHMRVAVIAMGYAEGLPAGSNELEVLISGERCPVVGKISMNLATVDVTNIEAKRGDEVVVVGRQRGAEGKSAEITFEDLAKKTGLRHHEIVVGFGQGLPKRYV